MAARPGCGASGGATGSRIATASTQLLDLVNYAPGTYDTALKEGAHVVSPTGAAGEGPGRSNVMATPTAENLQRLGALLTDGTLRSAEDHADAASASDTLATRERQPAGMPTAELARTLAAREVWSKLEPLALILVEDGGVDLATAVRRACHARRRAGRAQPGLVG